MKELLKLGFGLFIAQLSYGQNSFMNNTNQYNLNFINELTIFQTNQSNKEKLSNSIVLANNIDKQALFKVFDINSYNSFDNYMN